MHHEQAAINNSSEESIWPQPNMDLKIERLLKRDIQQINLEALPGYASRDLLFRFQTSPRRMISNDDVYAVRSETETNPIAAILWIMTDSFDADQITCHVLELNDRKLNAHQCRVLIEFVQSHYPETYCIRWLVDHKDQRMLELLVDLCYTIDHHMNTEIPDEERGGIYRAFRIARLYHIQRPDQGSAFARFPVGLLAIRGGEKAICSIQFLRPGESIPDKTLRWRAQHLGILDSKGCLIRSIGPEENACLNTDAIQQPQAVSEAKRQLDQYIAGERRVFELPLELKQGSDFQQKVWQSIQTIPYGGTATYEDLAAGLVTGSQKPSHLARAIGSACSANPLPVLIPCHRVIGKNGRLVGFNGGLDIKEYLLNHEMLGI